jgi:hypothetical protein
MATLNTSELQFAFTFFAKFNELYNYSFNKIIVPSTVMEGKDNYAYNGTDLVLDQFYFQFKMSEILVNSNASQTNHLSTPYFRIKVKNLPTAISSRGQLDYLIDHAKSGKNKVFYVAPSFAFPQISYSASSNSFWINKFFQSLPSEIDKYCAFIDISTIDSSWVDQYDKHIIIYNHDESFALFFSEPKKVKVAKDIFPSYRIDRIAPSNLSTIEEVTLSLKEKIIELIPNGEWENMQGNNVQKLQKIMLVYFNSLWLPLIVNRNQIWDKKINSIL